MRTTPERSCANSVVKDGGAEDDSLTGPGDGLVGGAVTVTVRFEGTGGGAPPPVPATVVEQPTRTRTPTAEVSNPRIMVPP
jgi:hypothetical protein